MIYTDFAAIPRGGYGIIYADPAWTFRNRCDTKATRWAGSKYGLMTREALMALPVAQLAAPDCALFIWGTSPTLEDLLPVINAWGFTFKTKAFYWDKETKTGKDHFGMGYWTRASNEDCWLATRGNPKRLDQSVRQRVRTPVGKHSAKPPEVRERIVRLLGDLPRIELFSRAEVPGWDAWGNQVEAEPDLIRSLRQAVPFALPDPALAQTDWTQEGAK